MALFSSKKTDTKKEVSAEKAPSTERKQKVVKAAANAPEVTVYSRDISHILKHARITEKATMHNLNNTYVFNVAVKATKRDIIRTVETLYKVTPRHVTISAIPTKNVRNRRTGKTGVKGGGKKAYVYLKKGETITI